MTSLPAGPLLPPAQRAMMAAMNDTAAPEHIERLEQAVLTQIHAHPEAIAVIGADATLTYAELGARAAGVAAALRAAGVGPGALVGVAFDGGWEAVVAVVGVLLAGGAYLPVDPHAPGDRLVRLLTDATAVVTRGAPRWAWPAERPAIDIDRCPSAPLPGPAVEPGDAEALAYVIYTSGSTGQPKGVMMTHRAAMNTLRDITTRFAIGPSDRVLAVSALSFDLSVYDIFGGLGAGATVVMPPPGARRDPRVLWELAAASGVTVWNSVPAILGLVAEYGATVRDAARRGGLQTLRLAMVSGDWVPLALPAAVRALAPACEVVSLGGATEVAIWSVAYPIARVDPDWTSIPYGRPLTNQRVYVLNDALQLCPVWVPGELYLGGVGLAVGYWGDPERTAARFITHPQTGERLYRTGDRARYRPEGTLELLGRVDTQVKLHGHRIEPGEIEAVLLQHPDIRAAVVVIPESGPRRLAACLVAATANPPSSESLRAHVGAALPPAMVPVSFTCVDQLPLTANGKVDRQAIASIEFAPAASSGTGGASIADSRVSETIASVLGLPRVGPHVRLLDLGADSSSMIQIANRLEALFGRRPTLELLFANPTVEEIGLYCQREPEPV